MRKCFMCGAETNRLLVCKRCGDTVMNRLNLAEAEKRGGLCVKCGCSVPPMDTARCVKCAPVPLAA